MLRLKKVNKKMLLVFVLVFAVIGATLLLATHAGTPSASLEVETTSLSGGASVINDSTASGGKAIIFNSTTPPPQIKPQIKGVVDRDAYNSSKPVSNQNLQIPDAYQAVVNNFVVMLNWDQIQPNNSSELNTSYIDDAISEANAKGMHFKLRILAGIHSPNWVKSLEGGPFSVYDIDKNTGEQFSGTSPKYWTPSVKSAYNGLMSKLAVKYDTNNTLASVSNSLCTTIFGEPFIRNLAEGNNFASYYGAGLTDALDQQCENDSIDIHNANWKYTRTETAVNPLAYKGTDSSGNTIEKFNVSFSTAWVARCRQVLGIRCIMGNNGFIATTSGVNYRTVIGAITCQGSPPPYFQTRQYATILSTGNTIDSVLQYAIKVGAGMVELPVQYRTTGTSPAQLAPLDAALEASNGIACPADKLMPNPS